MRKGLRLLFVSLLWVTMGQSAIAQKMLVYMDLRQTDHLKAYGLAYKTLERGVNVEWLLNYRGGSFLIDDIPELERMARRMGVAFEVVGGAEISQIYATIENSNMDVVLLEKAPRIAVYVPPFREPWDDAVSLALDYAEIPYDEVWDKEVLEGELEKYDWLHLHHEDFTGQYGKFYAAYRGAAWYQRQVAYNEKTAAELGFPKVSEEKKAVALAIRDYVSRGGLLFAEGSASETIDIALAAVGVDIVDVPFDGDPPDPNAEEKLDFSRTFAFEKFKLVPNPMVYAFSDIDTSPENGLDVEKLRNRYFTLFEFAAKYDPVPTMLTQDHVSVVKEFLGQTTGFRRQLIKPSVTILAEGPGEDQVKYLHGNYGRGTFTFFGGHDPEDFTHYVGDPPTNLYLHKNSPGYRLILNNVLFPAARKKKRKT